MTLLDDCWLNARKAHQCNCYWGTIAPGDRYRRQRAIIDGEPQTYKCHALCDAAYWRAHSDLGLYDDESPDWVEDIRPLAISFFTALTPCPAQQEGGE